MNGLTEAANIAIKRRHLTTYEMNGEEPWVPVVSALWGSAAGAEQTVFIVKTLATRFTKPLCLIDLKHSCEPAISNGTDVMIVRRQLERSTPNVDKIRWACDITKDLFGLAGSAELVPLEVLIANIAMVIMLHDEIIGTMVTRNAINNFINDMHNRTALQTT
ncbi:MAG TPA: hypothetical protein VLG40_00910 [Candidatus Saccharimonas sp.]|nr:hypothetical protein [Candidatus Saccharimonas sp.]